MKTVAAALFVASAQAGAATQASKVCVNNSAGFVLDYYFDEMTTGQLSHESDSYPIDQMKCMDIADSLPGIEDGALILTYVEAHGGETKAVDSAVVYKASPAITATYTCRGATLTYDCTLNGEDSADIPVEDREMAQFMAQDFAILFANI